MEIEVGKAKTVDQYLSEIDYSVDPHYVPSEFALEFVTFIKLVDGGESENKTPVIHYHMLDNFVVDNGKDTINMCHRGIAKSTLKEYLLLYLGVYGTLPGFGKVPYALYVSDSIDNGVKKMRKSLEYRWNNSKFLQEYIPEIRFTDIRWEFINKLGNSFVASGYGAKALALHTELFTEYGRTTIKDIQVGDRIYGADGKLTTVTLKSEVFNRPMYSIELLDGRNISVCEEHINSVVLKDKHKNTYSKQNLTTKELLELPLQHLRNRKRKGKPDYTSKENLIFIENCSPIEFPTEKLPIDPYTLGVILGDGRIRKDCGSVELTGHIEDFPHYLNEIPYEFGKYQIDNRNTNVRTQSIRGLGKDLVAMKLNVHGDYKFIPESYLRGSIEQRLSLLQGLMDTDGTVSARKINSVASFTTNSVNLAQGVSELVYSLGGYVHWGKHSTGAYRIQVHLNMPIFRLPRKAKKHRLNSKQMVPIKAIKAIADEPSQCIRVDNEDHQFIVDTFVRTHNTGVRGTRENGSRPVLALLDDLVSDEDARSPTVIEKIEDTVYKAIDYALHPNRRKIIWSGTPFNAKDPLYKAVESGAWNVNVYPVCEHFPCTKEEFKGSWEDRFDYEYVLKQYEKALKSGKVETFMQELMLKIMSEDDRLIQDNDITWFKRSTVLENKPLFNFYITTDFATSKESGSDYSVISVWAYTANGDWLWVDGICKRQLMDKNINDLFRLVQMYRPQSVGIEVTGQQGGFIPWIQDQMLVRNCYFNLASENNSNRPGIRPVTKKIDRFHTIVPLFKTHKIKFPEELRGTDAVLEAMDELRLVTREEFKSKHDDFIDTISMLSVMGAWKPSEAPTTFKEDGSIMWEDDVDDYPDGVDSYVV